LIGRPKTAKKSCLRESITLFELGVIKNVYLKGHQHTKTTQKRARYTILAAHPSRKAVGKNKLDLGQNLCSYGKNKTELGQNEWQLRKNKLDWTTKNCKKELFKRVNHVIRAWGYEKCVSKRARHPFLAAHLNDREEYRAESLLEREVNNKKTSSSYSRWLFSVL